MIVHLTFESDENVLVHLGAVIKDAGIEGTNTDPVESNENKARGRTTRITQALRGTASTSGASTPLGETLLEDTLIKDARVVTIVCRQHGYWFPSVLHYVQRIFQLGDAALARLQEQSTFKALFVAAEKSAARTICHGHLLACGKDVGLVYDTVYLRIKIPGTCSGIFENSVVPPQSGEGTSDEFVTLNGFPSGIDGILMRQTGVAVGVISRAWKWMPKREAIDKGVEGLEPAKDANAQVLHLDRQETRVASILLGIEAAAPLKEDFFGKEHGPSAKSKDRSAFGKRKWRDFRRGGMKVPADLGGVQVLITKPLFEDAMRHCSDLKLCFPHQCSTGLKERAFFQTIFQGTSPQATAMLQEVARDTSEKSRKSRD